MAQIWIGADMLLFIACGSGRFRPARGQRVRGLYPPRQERSLLLALMGLARTTQIETDDIPKLLVRIVGTAPDTVTVLTVREPLVDLASAARTQAAAGSADASDVRPGRVALPQWHLVDWIKLANNGGENAGDKTAAPPVLQSDRQAVAALWVQFKVALAARPDELAELLRAWVAAKGKGSGWASMPAPDARKWVECVRALMPGIAIEAFRAWKDDARRNKKSPAKLLDDADDIKEGQGHHYLRFADTRDKRNRHRNRSGRQRSHSQRSITWFVVALERQIRIMQADKSAPPK